MTRSDEELVVAFQQGDASAFDILHGRWETKIKGAIYRVVGPGEDIRDLSQETFLKAYRGLHGFRKDARFSSWLYQIAVNVCRDRLRRRRHWTELSFDELEEASQEPRMTTRAEALDAVAARDVSRVVEAAMATLAPEQREAIVLKEYEGLTFAEIAGALGVPISTVKTRLYRGLTHLREQLEARGIRPAAVLAAPAP